MKTIELTKGQVALVDDEDFERLSKYSWCYAGHYAKRGGTKKGCTTQLMHRFIMDAPQGLDIDHINHDRLDNRKANLRLATRSQNSANSGPKSNSFSQYKGVWFVKKDKVWRAEILVNGKRKMLGRHKDEIDAAQAYDRAALEAWGEFAYLNFPGDVAQLVSAARS